jgi:anti-anti-sigma regulatory factor
MTSYLADGRRLGQRLLYVGSSSEEELREELSGMRDAERLFADGVLGVLSLQGIFEHGQPIDPDAQLRVYGAATEGALKEGFTGLRVAAEVTQLVTEPATWEAHVRWETVADRFMASMPLSAMCCYDRRALPETIVSDLARVHPAVCGPESLVPFRIYAGGERNTLMLEGEVDFFSADDFDRLLAIATPDHGRAVLDLSKLGFIDQHGAMRLAERTGGWLRLRNVPASTRRLCELIEVAI